MNVTTGRDSAAAQHPDAGRALLHPAPNVWFSLLALVISWLLWAPLVADALGWIDRPVSPYWHLAGGFGPLLAAMIVTVLTDGQEGLRDLLRRMGRWQVHPDWLGVAILTPVILFGFAAVLVWLVDGVWPDPGRFGESTEYPRLPLLLYWVANVICYGFGEEVGWRGYALPRLMPRFSALTAASLISIVWGLWHLPLFAFADGLSAMGPAEIVGWWLSLWVGSILFTWLYLGARHSLLVVALFHGLWDVAINSPLDGPIQIAMGALVTIWGVATIGALKRCEALARGQDR